MNENVWEWVSELKQTSWMCEWGSGLVSLCESVSECKRVIMADIELVEVNVSQLVSNWLSASLIE